MVNLEKHTYDYDHLYYMIVLLDDHLWYPKNHLYRSVHLL